MAPSKWLKGTVKSVLSGDTLIIMGVPRGAAPPEKQITLSSLKAPRLVIDDSLTPQGSKNLCRRGDGMEPVKMSRLRGTLRNF